MPRRTLEKVSHGERYLCCRGTTNEWCFITAHNAPLSRDRLVAYIFRLGIHPYMDEPFSGIEYNSAFDVCPSASKHG